MAFFNLSSKSLFPVDFIKLKIESSFKTSSIFSAAEIFASCLPRSLSKGLITSGPYFSVAPKPTSCSKAANGANPSIALDNVEAPNPAASAPIDAAPKSAFFFASSCRCECSCEEDEEVTSSSSSSTAPDGVFVVAVVFFKIPPEVTD